MYINIKMTELYLYIFINFVVTFQLSLQTDTEQLTEIFFNNLQADPKLLADPEFSEISKEFVDRQLENYRKLVLYPNQNDSFRIKRSLPNLNENFVEFHFNGNLPVQFPKSVDLFQQNSIWYFAVTDSSKHQQDVIDRLTIYKFMNNSFEKVAEESVKNCTQIKTHNFGDYTLIISVEKELSKFTTNILKFDYREEITTVQSIEAVFTSDVSLWIQDEDIFLSIAQYRSEDTTKFDVVSQIYKWVGSYFDRIQIIETSGVRKITPFSIGPNHFLAVANERSDDVFSKTYSEIFKYNLDLDQFETYQRLLTKSCLDIKYFKSTGFEEEHFLIETNSANQDENSLENSIIYKFVDNYFIPFQNIEIEGIQEWIPIEYNSKVILLAFTTNYIKIFLFNGWRFELQSIDTHFKETGIISSKLLYMNEQTLLFVTNSTDVLMIEMSFKNISNDLFNEEADLLQWCQKNLEKHDNLETDKIVGRPSRADIEEVDENNNSHNVNEPTSDDLKFEEDKFSELNSQLRQYQTILENIERKIQERENTQTNVVINRNITAKTVIVNNDIFSNNVQTQTMNDIPIENILENTININDGFHLRNVTNFDFVRFNFQFITNKINGIDTNKLLRRDMDLEMDTIKILGDVYLKNTTIVYNKINNMTIDSANIILINQEQNFENFKTEGIVEGVSVNVNEMNKHKMIPFGIITQLDTLNVENIEINGLINGIHIPTLYKYVLRNSGENQEISDTYFIDSLEADNMNVSGKLSDKIFPDDFVLTTRGSYDIHQDIRFTKPLIVNNLTATRLLNSISVFNGKLDILLQTEQDVQYITGAKTAENAHLPYPLKLIGKLINKDAEAMNPIAQIKDDYEFDKDITIRSRVGIENFIKADNIISSKNPNMSITKVRKSAIKLVSKNISNHLVFAQQLNVDDIFVNTINNIDPQTWVVTVSNQSKQIITGLKTFPNNLEVSGSTSALKINNINLNELEENILMKNGDQVIDGRHFVKYIAAEKGLDSDHIEFGPKPWDEVIKIDSAQKINGTISIKGMESQNIIAKNMNIIGSVNNLNFSNVVLDSVPRSIGNSAIIAGQKVFKNLTIENLVTPNDLDMEKINLIKDGEVKLEVDLNFTNDIFIENINFAKTCNDVDKQYFDSIVVKDLLKNPFHDVVFKKVTIFDTAFVSSNSINGQILDDIKDNTVKIDEEFSFESAQFLFPILSDNITNFGHIENLDLDNIIDVNADEIQVIEGVKTFKDVLDINGSLYIEGLLNDKDVKSFCDLTFNRDSFSKQFEVYGNVIFGKDPQLYQMNNVNMENLKTSGWLQNKPTIIRNNINFKNITFNNDIQLNGYINDVNIQDFNDNYFSLTKNQKVQSTITFEGGVVFKEDLVTPELKSELVNGVNLKILMDSIILDDVDQLFTHSPFFENVFVTNVEGDFLVNDLNLENDVMRYDKLNVVTGPKTFQNMNTNILKLSENITVQDVNLWAWIRNVVLKSGTTSIVGEKIFQNVTFENGLGLKNLFNNQKFNNNTVLLKNIPQEITGLKQFIRNDREPISFKSLKLKGLLNDITFRDLIHNQAYKNADNIFKSKMLFNNNITTHNLIINDLYNNINISSLISNVSTLGALNNFMESFKNLKSMSEIVRKSIIDQSNLMQYYKPIMSLSKVEKAIQLDCTDGSRRLFFFSYENSSLVSRSYDWIREDRIFQDSGFFITIEKNVNFFEKVTLDGETYIYVENVESTPRGKLYEGKLIQCKDSLNFITISTFEANTLYTEHITSARLPFLKKVCLVFITGQRSINIMCGEDVKQLYLFQSLYSPGAKMVSVIIIHDIPYLVVSNVLEDKQHSSIQIWKFNNETLAFDVHQTIYEEKPQCLSTVQHQNQFYLAVAFGHFGIILVSKFNHQSGKFEPWQTLTTEHSPTYVNFAVLPSNELMLYVRTKEPVIVYKYQGIFGFTQKLQSNIITGQGPINWFSIGNQHFITAKYNDEINVIQAIFNRSH